MKVSPIIRRIIYHNPITYRLQVIIAVVMMSLPALTCRSFTVSQQTREEAKLLLEECESAAALRQYDLMVSRGTALMRLGMSAGREDDEIIGASYVLRGRVNRRDTADMSPDVIRLETSLPHLEGEKKWGVAAHATKALSVYYHLICSDFSRASSYAFRSLEHSRRAGSLREEVDALSGLASIYFNKGDNSGFDYALASYRKARELKEERELYVPTSNMANYLFNQNKLPEALKYLKESDGIASGLHMDSERSYINSFYGDIYGAMGRNTEAEKYYRLGISDDKASSKYDRIYSRICYAIFLMRENRAEEALRQLSDAEALSEGYRVQSFRIQIYNLLSSIYEHKGDYRKGLDYYRLGAEMRDSIFTREKEREFTLLDLRYKVSEEQRLNAEQSMEIMRKNRTLAAGAAVAVLLLALLIGGFFYYKRRMRDYRATVTRSLENAETERRLREQLEKALADRRKNASQKTSGLSDSKRQEMFATLERMMNEEKIYRQTDLSLEKTAAMLQTNRTYLSQIINEETEGSFSTYINSFRLREAIELLSDPDNDAPLKNIGLEVGFSSPSNFYSLFRQKVGVSPSVFRSNVKNIKNGNKNNQFDNQD